LTRRSPGRGGNHLTIDLARPFLSFSKVMRLLVEILIIATVIYVGWNKPFKQYADEANRKITSTLDSLGSGLQKHEDKSVKRY
jgi:TRAP-type C4-dicarboxylate transport system permease small subunit